MTQAAPFNHSERAVVMLGATLSAPGGMTSVTHIYQRSGLFERCAVRYLCTYESSGALTQVRTMVQAMLTLLGWLLMRQVALVHANSASRGSFWRKSLLVFAAWCFRVPYVFHLHSGEFAAFYAQRPAWAKAWIRWVLRHASQVLVVTPVWQTTISHLEPRARTAVLTNPVEIPARCNAVRAVPQRVLFLGRLRVKKGVYELVRALPAVLAAHPHVKFCIAGDEELAQVQALAAQLGVAHAIELPGWLEGEAKAKALAQADVLVLPSHFEALGMCLLEAMAQGVPVVATRVGGIPFVLDEGRCGLLVPREDPPALAVAINTLLGDAELRRTYGQRGRSHVEAIFSSGAVTAQLEQLWRQAVFPKA